jgi:hypothetical protein
MEGQTAQLRRSARFYAGLVPRALPIAVVILLGSALGPYGLGLLSESVLASLDPAMPVALAALGVSVGIGISLRTPRDRRHLAATSTRAVIAMGIVAAGVAVTLSAWGAVLEPAGWFSAALLAICAADDPLPVLFGGAALAFLREPSPAAAALLMLQATGVALVIASAGWLLLTRAAPGTQRVYVIAMLLLLGGASEYLSLSALMSGLAAGFFWEAVGGPTRNAIRGDVLYLQRPVVLLVLVVSGARTMLSPVVISVGLSYLLLRFAGATAGSAAARKLFPSWTEADRSLFAAPGVVGLAFALNAVRAIGSDPATILSIVVVGVAGSQLLESIMKPAEASE